jgi:hypothetical protein
MNQEDRRRMLWRARKQRQRERERDVRDIVPAGRDIVLVKTNVTHPVSACNPLPSVTVTSDRRDNIGVRAGLTVVAIGMLGVGITINAWFARSLGSTEFAGWLFLALGIVSDSAAFILPRQAEWLWRQRRPLASGMAWGLWAVTFAFALIASAGFASINIADVTTARAARTSPAIELAQRKLDAATAAVQAECRRVGPLCHARQAEQRQALADLAAGQAAVEAGADPQVAKAAQLVAWLTPWRPNADDLAMVRLALLALLPQLGGLVLLVARHSISNY